MTLLAYRNIHQRREKKKILMSIKRVEKKLEWNKKKRIAEKARDFQTRESRVSLSYLESHSGLTSKISQFKFKSSGCVAFVRWCMTVVVGIFKIFKYFFLSYLSFGFNESFSPRRRKQMTQFQLCGNSDRSREQVEQFARYLNKSWCQRKKSLKPETFYKFAHFFLCF